MIDETKTSQSQEQPIDKSVEIARQIKIKEEIAEEFLDVFRNPDKYKFDHSYSIVTATLGLVAVGKEDINVLLSHLNEPDAKIRLVIVGALAATEDDRAIYPLIEFLDDPDSKIRTRVFEALIQRTWGRQNYGYDKWAWINWWSHEERKRLEKELLPSAGPLPQHNFYIYDNDSGNERAVYWSGNGWSTESHSDGRFWYHDPLDRDGYEFLLKYYNLKDRQRELPYYKLQKTSPEQLKLMVVI